jgi:excisionase family DNA binding protein
MMMSNSDAQWLNPGEAALEAGCSRKTILRAISSGKLRCYQLNQRVIEIRRSDFKSWLSSSRSTVSWQTKNPA